MPWVIAEVVAGEILLGGSPAAAGCRRPSRMARWLRPTDAGVLDGQLVPGVLPHLQGKAGGCALERQRRAAIDTNSLTPEAQRAGVVGRAGHIQIGATALSILVAGKADRQVAGVQRSGSLRGIDQKGKAGEIVGYGEPVPAAGQLQRTKSVVLQPLNLGALRRVVVGPSLGGVPLLQLMQRFGHFILWKVRVGQEIQPAPHGKQSQQQDSTRARRSNRRYILVASWRMRVDGRVVGRWQ